MTERLRTVIERVVAEGKAVSAAGMEHDVFPVAISAAEGESLRDWIVREGAFRTIEVGLGYGISALFTCEGLLTVGNAGARHVVIDPNQERRFGNIGLQLLKEAGVGAMVEVHTDDSQIALPRLLSDGRSFDLAFVDGNHRFDGVFVDLVYLGRLVQSGGVIVVDDYQLPSVARAVAFFVANLGWTLEEVSAVDDQHQWAVLRTAGDPLDRPYWHFVDF